MEWKIYIKHTHCTNIILFLINEKERDIVLVLNTTFNGIPIYIMLFSFVGESRII